MAQFVDGPQELLVVQTEGEDPESDDPVAVAGGAVPKLSQEQKEAALEILSEDPAFQTAVGTADYDADIGIWTEFDEETNEISVVGASVEVTLESPETWPERTWPATEYELGANGYEGGVYQETDFVAIASDVKTLDISLDLVFDEEMVPIEGEAVEIAPLTTGPGEVEVNPEELGAYDPAVAGY